MSAMWKLEKDLCRCCHAEGSFKHLSDPCFLLGQEEIYSVMLKDCLDIKIVPMTGPLSDATYTICEACVGRLRDASNFKRQVQDCEQRFKEMYSKNMVKGFEVKAEPFEGDAAMKQESRSVDESDDDDEAFMKFDDELSGGDTSYEEHEEAEEMITVEIQGEPSKGKGKLKARRKTPNKRAKKEKPIKTEGDDSTEATASGEKKKDQEKHTMKACYKCKKIRRIEDLGETKKCPDCATVLTNCVVRLVREQLTAGPVTNFFITTDPVNDGQAKSEPQAAGSSASDPAPTSVLRNFLLRGAGNSKTENESETSDSLKVKIEDSDDDSLANLVKKRDKFEVYGCKECQKTFDKKSALQKHIRSFHRKHTFNCPDCPETFPTKRTLQTHAKKVHDKNTGVEKDTRYKTFIKVIREPPGEVIYACTVCDVKFHRLVEITAHTKVHAHKRTCPVCFKFFPDLAEYKAHRAAPHPGAKKFACHDCECVYETVFDLRKHKIAAHNKRKCPHCEEMVTKKSLENHLREFHSESLLTCGVCGYKALRQASINTHQKKVHLKEKNVICDICHFPFYNSTDLKRHMVKHKAEKIFECGHCKKKFARKSTLYLHEKIHTGEKNKVCVACGAAFVQKASLNYHMVKYHPDRV
ncbi:zinc finger protein 184-like isoform X5 [Leguminivora glycinivorella]|uniref:zinc finger protein 184-like isoform X5 n=1 Tax=Leguminivora glycinivorella TaxID=1035111 RepID=UPI00200EF16D|nr:zinc finger protein 184-like isoform X5 [Leguminivora glycinivorella]